MIARIIGKLRHLSVEMLTRPRRSVGKVYMLHDVAPSGSNPEGEFVVDASDLERFLAEQGKMAIRVEDWRDAMKINREFIAFTIDDVPEGFYLNGFPLFQKYNIPFTIFVCVDYLDKEGYISTDQLRQMAASPLCTIGSHGQRHIFFKDIPASSRRAFLEDSRRELERVSGRRVRLFAYPYGSYYACGHFGKQLVLKVYDYAFGTVQVPICRKNLLSDAFVPRINLKFK